MLLRYQVFELLAKQMRDTFLNHQYNECDRCFETKVKYQNEVMVNL